MNHLKCDDKHRHLQAAIYLHEEGAKYPRKILYQHSPPHLSLEALEVYEIAHLTEYYTAAIATIYFYIIILNLCRHE